MRIRTIKPEFWSHPVMGRLDGTSQALAIGLLNMADDDGYFLGDPAAIRSALRPFDDDSTNVRRALDELSRAGWVTFKTHPEMGQIGLVVNFAAHQRIDRHSPSKLKKYYDLGLDESSTNARRGLDERSLLEGKGREGNREGKGTGAGALSLELVSEDSRKPKPAKPSDELIADFADAGHGAYLWQGAKDGVALAALLKAATLEEVRTRWRRGLAAPSTAWASCRTVAQLKAKWNDLAHDAPKDLKKPVAPAVFSESRNVEDF